MFDLRSARYFIAVADELHFGRAAARLHMSQPPLSQAIRQLERDVGARLFERDNRSVALTAAGEAFAVECRALLRHAESVAETPRLVAAGTRVQLTLGAVASALSWPLPHTIELLRHRAPHIAIRVEELDTHEAVQGLLDNRLDVALARLASNRAGIDTRMLLQDDFVALLPESHPLAASQSPLDLTLLADDPWIWLAREISPDYHDDMTAVCRASGFSPRIRHWVRSIATQTALVSSAVGITLIPESSATHVPPGVTVKQIARPTRAVVLSASTRVKPEPAAQLFVTAVTEVVRSRR